MQIALGVMTIDDYEAVSALWRHADGVGLGEDDSRENIERYLARNPGLSFVAKADDRVVGAVLCGHDGRRGYLHHLAVDTDHRRRGIGGALVEACLDSLWAIGVRKCNIFVFDDNIEGRRFWQRSGWADRSDLRFMQKETQDR